MVGALIGAVTTIAVAIITAVIGHSAGVVYISLGSGASGSPGASGPTTAPTSPSLPKGVSVRRSTGSLPIKLSPGYSVNLDDNVTPNWSVGPNAVGVGTAGGDSDVGFSGVQIEFGTDAAVESNATAYATCAKETAYSESPIADGDLQSGEKLCVRTDGHRYALITIIGVSANTQLEFSATVWDPPFAPS